MFVCLFVCLFELMLKSSVKCYGHVGPLPLLPKLTTGVQLVFFFSSGLLGAQGSREAYRICESSFLIHHGGYHDLCVCP